MSQSYEYQPTARHQELAEGKPVKTHDVRKTRSPNVLVRMNAKFGLKITLVVGTMWAAYLFTILALFALPSAIHQGTYYIIVWLSSSFLQLVLLPIIIVGQNIQAAAADKRSEDTYKDAEAVLAEAKMIQDHLLVQDQAMSDIMTRMEAVIAEVKAMREH